ncbi:MAG: glycosyltransferase family 39 protein [Gemmataceae bacterium]
MSAPLPLSPVDSGVPPADAWEAQQARRLGWLTAAVVLVGVAWRLTRYLLQFPIWGDEGMLLVNYFQRGYLDIFGPIDYCQIAPLLFHWAEITAIRLFGTGDLAVRLPALLACLGSVALFWRLAALTLPPLGRTLAVAILAVSIWPATTGALVKPYSSDLFFSLALLVPAATWFRQPDRLGPLVALTLIAPLAMAGSYPAVFVAGGISIALLPDVWRRREGRLWATFVAYNLAVGGAFVAHYLLVGRPHLASPTAGTTTDAGMHLYWQAGFPPTSPVALLRWLLLAHIGQTAAYPVGGQSGASLATVALAASGGWLLWKRGQTRLLLVIAGTFALWFVAGVLRKYPYGISCRLSQHVAPFYCLLAGLGLAGLLARLAEPARWRGTLAAVGLLAALGVGGIARDIWRPYRDEDALWARRVANDLLAQAGDDPIVLLRPDPMIHPSLLWYLGRDNDRLARLGVTDPRTLAADGASVWTVDVVQLADERATVGGWLGQGWRFTERTRPRLKPREPREPFWECCIDRWVHDPASSRRTMRTIGRPPR